MVEFLLCDMGFSINCFVKKAIFDSMDSMLSLYFLRVLMQKNKFFLVLLSIVFAPSLQCYSGGFNVGVGAWQTVGPVFFGAKFTQKVSGKTVAIVAGMILAGKIAYDVSWHGEYADRVKKCHSALRDCIHLNHVQAVDHAALKDFASKSMKKEIIFLEQSLYNSYGSWLCPWNWTAQQKELFQCVQIVSILTSYADLIALGDLVAGADIVKGMRQLYTPMGMYPCVYGYWQLQRHSAFVRSHGCTDRVQAALLRDMGDYLDKFADLLTEQNEYVQELQTMKTHEQQQQMNNNLAHMSHNRD
jgi:hypothetical protein